MILSKRSRLIFSGLLVAASPGRILQPCHELKVPNSKFTVQLRPQVVNDILTTALRRVTRTSTRLEQLMFCLSCLAIAALLGAAVYPLLLYIADTLRSKRVKQVSCSVEVGGTI